MIQKPFLAILTTTGLLLTPLALPPIALAQQLVNVSPTVGSANAPPDTSISGQFDTNGGASVEPNSVKILVNGQDVTSRSTITRSFFTYRPDQAFPPGQVRVQVEYRNTNGETRTNSWTFTVQSQSAIQITSVTHNAVGNPLRTGATFSVTIDGTPGAQASVLLIEDSQTVREFAARETSAGVYVANLVVERGDRVNEGVVVGRLRRQNQTTYAAATQPVAFNATGTVGNGSTGGNSINNGSTTSTQALQPRFTNPKDGAKVGKNGFTLTGQTRPNATVQIKVVAAASLLGVNVAGQTVLDQEVSADSRGRFQVNVPAPSVALPGLQYKVQATAKDGNEVSSQTEITLKE